jgi:hypothetical protein
MLRAVDLGLFLVPTALFIAWLVLGRVATQRFVVAAVLAVAVLGALAVIYGQERSIPAGDTYVPARLEDGRIVPGHGTPSDAAPASR